MSILKIGFLHPGEMGISLAVSAKESRQDVYWCSEGRSQSTQLRADKYALKALTTLKDISQTCDLIISVCPPHAALDQAIAVIETGFKGIYADVNAISPDSVKAIAAKMSEANIDFVDGGIIGQPAWKENATWLYLCGDKAATVAACFKAGMLETTVLEGDIGKASALKMCFAANSKGVTALITAILATAEEYGVRSTLEAQWNVYNPDFTQQTQSRIRKSARKAWRFTGEMEEIAATLKSAGLPDAFHLGASNIYSRQEQFKNAEGEVSVEEILQAILTSKDANKE